MSSFTGSVQKYRMRLLLFGCQVLDPVASFDQVVADNAFDNVGGIAQGEDP